MTKRDTLVLKFGGTSMGNRESIKTVMQIIRSASTKARVVTVVSAMAGVTDRLLEIGHHCLNDRAQKAKHALKNLESSHQEAFSSIAKNPATARWIHKFVEGAFGEMRGITQGIRLLHEFSERTRDKLLAYGEILSASLLAAVMSESSGRYCHADAREFIVANRTQKDSVVDFPATERMVKEHLLPLLQKGLSPIVPGFICRAADGHATTLGRNGSDYSAAIVGAALKAREIRIYTDVDGILTADPNLVAEASILPRISYQEAAEMSYFGAKVLHPKTMIPAITHRIPIRILNTFNPAAKGTLVATSGGKRHHQIKTVTSVRGLSLLNIQGNGMVGIPGMASRLFGVLAREDVNIMMISQSSSEHSVCLIIHSGDEHRAVPAIRREFAVEIERNLIEGVEVVRDVAIVSIIGAGMRGTPGISGKFFNALGKPRVNVLAIAQGASELNISAAIREKDYRHAVQSIHSAFGLTQELNVFLFGCGNIGRTLLRQIDEHSKLIAEKLEVNVKVLGVANSRHLLFSDRALDNSDLRALGAGAALADMSGAEPRPATDALLERIAGTFKSDLVVVDATAADLASTHIRALKHGFHIVTANKRPLSNSLASYREIQETKRAKGLNYQYEATFGAGLPLLSTLQDLIHTGDRIISVQGCLSGTLGFLCSLLDAGIPFSEAVREAMSRGYTEPDPRDDLSGIDVARKALIISRALGTMIEMKDVRLQAMIPRRFFNDAPLPRFLDSLPVLNASIKREVVGARKNGKVLRFMAEINGPECRVGLRQVSKDSPIGRLAGPDNILVFRTQRYDDNPLVIQGPGAGASVTAAGVLSDLLKIAKWI